MASVRMLCLLLLSLSVGRQSVSATVTAISEPSVSAVVSVTAITGLQITLLATAETRKSGFGRSLVGGSNGAISGGTKSKMAAIYIRH